MPKKSKGPPKRPAPLRQEKPKQQNKGEPLEPEPEPEPEPGPRTPTPRPIRKNNSFSRYHIEQLPENLRPSAKQLNEMNAAVGGVPDPYENIQELEQKAGIDAGLEMDINKRAAQLAKHEEIKADTLRRRAEEMKKRQARRPPPRRAPPRRAPKKLPPKPGEQKPASSRRRKRRGTRRNRRISRRKRTRKKKRTN